MPFPSISALARKLPLAALLLAAAAALPGCEAFAPNTPFTALPDLQRAGLNQQWQTIIGLAGGERIVNAWRVGDSLYVTTNHKRLIRIVAASGVKAWDVQVGIQTQRIFRPVDLGNNRVLVLNQGSAFILDKAAGVVVASNTLNMIVTTDPIVDAASNTLCVGGLDYFYGLYLDQLGSRKWDVSAPQDLFAATPAVVGNTLLIASRQGHLWQIRAATGEWNWKDRKTNGEVVAPLASNGGALFVAALDQRVYAFAVANGGELWQVRLEGTLDKMPIPIRSQLLVPAGGKGLYSLSADTGDTQWIAPGVSQIATISGNHAWAQDAGGNLDSVSLDDGSILSSTPVPAAQLAVYNNSDDQLVVLINKAGVVGGFMPR
ncbi:MAG TPA: PQQ-binding-like beta-propeller repeat protein [Phycisphaerae bacterium]|nr:PQQ-binding-like beta-propeller repeat protein [Phycisphaerae bacterium]